MISIEGLAVSVTEETAIASQNAGQALGPAADSRRPAARSTVLWLVIVLLVAAGCVGIERELSLLWRCWTTDPLRSIGMLIPPVSIVLTLRVWRENGWELGGSWWGLVSIAAAFFVSILHRNAELFLTFGTALVSLIPLTLPVYLYGSGIVLLFAGARVWRKAWFPLALLLLSQPVPVVTSGMIDLPLQNISARVARDFATLIRFAPTTSQLRLMFSPDFGMFIAPGCDGIRGAVALGYLALILGYLKRVSFRRWAAYAIGGVLLGYLFNLIRLCVLVVYYRIALGVPMLESVAKQADYAIGSCLFLVAILIFFRLASLKEKKRPATGFARAHEALRDGCPSSRTRNSFVRCLAFAALLGVVLALPSSALRSRQNPPAATSSSNALAGRFPKSIGSFTLTRAWYEQSGGQTLVESGAYSAPGSDEITLAVWVAPFVYYHDANSCWLARGLKPERVSSLPFVTVQGSSLDLSTGFYNDGVTDSIVVSVACTPGSCSQSQQVASRGHFSFFILKPQAGELAEGRAHPVPIMIRIDRLGSSQPVAVTQGALTAEARKFISGLDPMSLSQAFQ